jgi:hypothetical protein
MDAVAFVVCNITGCKWHEMKLSTPTFGKTDNAERFLAKKYLILADINDYSWKMITAGITSTLDGAPHFIESSYLHPLQLWEFLPTN